MGANVAYLRFKYGIAFEGNQDAQIACIRKHHCLHCLDKDKCAVLSVLTDLQKCNSDEITIAGFNSTKIN